MALTDLAATSRVALRVRCGLHAGIVERRDNDYFGGAVNRAARIMGAAHGGQIILSEAVVEQVADRIPARCRCVIWAQCGYAISRVPSACISTLRRDFPALRSLEATPNNLPQQVSSFVGRERALAEVRQMLTYTRLLTVVGVGGLGKTRLSLQVGAEVLDDYSDGVWFVELAPLSDARLVPQAVASVLGVKEERGRPVQEALLKLIEDRQLLLILDNCEHLADACAELAKELLQSGPQVKVLATSREPLRVAARRRTIVDTYGPGSAKHLSIAHSRARGGATVPRPRVAAQPAFTSPTERDGGGRDLPPARWHSVGARTRRGACARAFGGDDRQRLPTASNC